MKKAGDIALTLTSSLGLPIEAIERDFQKAQEEIHITKYTEKKAQAIQACRVARDKGEPAVIFSSRPFVMTTLPLRRPPNSDLIYERRNGDFILRVVGDPEFGLPFGQDRLIPIWLATMVKRTHLRKITFRAGAEILEMFGLPKDGRTYNRLVEGLWRVFHASVYWGKFQEVQQAQKRLKGTYKARISFLDEMQLWTSSDPDQQQLPDPSFENYFVVSERFYSEVCDNPIFCDLYAVRGLSQSPGALDFYLWVSHRCYTAKGPIQIPLFGEAGLAAQLGSIQYKRERRFREIVSKWILEAKRFWPKCPVAISEDGQYLQLNHALAITLSQLQ
jgi:hypothetical protein